MGRKSSCHLCNTEFNFMGKGTMQLVYSRKNKKWYIQCKETSDYHEVHYCPECGRELKLNSYIKKGAIILMEPSSIIVPFLVCISMLMLVVAMIFSD